MATAKPGDVQPTPSDDSAGNVQPQPQPAKPGGMTPDQSNAVELARTYGGRDIVAVALVVVAGTFALTVMAFRDGTAVAAALGSVTTLIGTLVGSYFGFQAGNQGRTQDAAAAETANRTAVAAAALVPESEAPTLFAEMNEIANSSAYGMADFD